MVEPAMNNQWSVKSADYLQNLFTYSINFF